MVQQTLSISGSLHQTPASRFGPSETPGVEWDTVSTRKWGQQNGSELIQPPRTPSTRRWKIRRNRSGRKEVYDLSGKDNSNKKRNVLKSEAVEMRKKNGATMQEWRKSAFFSPCLKKLKSTYFLLPQVRTHAVRRGRLINYIMFTSQLRFFLK